MDQFGNFSFVKVQEGKKPTNEMSIPTFKIWHAPQLIEQKIVSLLIVWDEFEQIQGYLWIHCNENKGKETH